MNRTIKSKKIKGFIICFLTISIISLIISILFHIMTFNYKNSKPSNISTSNTPTDVKEETYKLSMVMCGDALIHSSVYKDAYKNNAYDFKPMIESIKPIVSKYDLAFYNQETVLGGTDIGLSDYPTFNSPYEVGDAMIDAGFNIVSLANNHTMDRGQTAIENSIRYWEGKNNVLTAGSYLSFDERNEIRIKEKNNISYTLLSYTYGTNGITVPKGKEYLVNIYEKEQVKKDVESVKGKVDVIIVSMHWGTEYTHTPTAEQEEWAKYLSSLGVNIIIGHHPHVIQPITKIGNTLVIYSLGNFISAQDKTSRLIGLMAMVDITKKVKGNESNISINNVNTELLYTYYKGFRNFNVIPFSKITSDYLNNYKELYGTYSKIVKQYDDSITINNID